MSRAYDEVWRAGMLYKMLNSNITGRFFNVIKSMYSSTKAYIRFNGMRSDTYISNTGIKQGYNLSCLIFALYLNDLEDTTLKQNNCKGINICDEDNITVLKLFIVLTLQAPSEIFL